MADEQLCSCCNKGLNDKENSYVKVVWHNLLYNLPDEKKVRITCAQCIENDAFSKRFVENWLRYAKDSKEKLRCGVCKRSLSKNNRFIKAEFHNWKEKGEKWSVFCDYCISVWV